MIWVIFCLPGNNVNFLFKNCKVVKIYTLSCSACFWSEINLALNGITQSEMFDGDRTVI